MSRHGPTTRSPLCRPEAPLRLVAAANRAGPTSAGSPPRGRRQGRADQADPLNTLGAVLTSGCTRVLGGSTPQVKLTGAFADHVSVGTVVHARLLRSLGGEESMMVQAFDLNVEKVLEHWSPAHALREVIANALDEHALIGRADRPEIVKDDAGVWHVRDHGRGLALPAPDAERVGREAGQRRRGRPVRCRVEGRVGDVPSQRHRGADLVAARHDRPRRAVQARLR